MIHSSTTQPEIEMKTLYEKAKAEFDLLPEVNGDQLDGTIAHLVYRAQHEVDMIDEGDGVREFDDYAMPRSDYNKIKRFIKKWSGK
jgi:hypothetical protein